MRHSALWCVALALALSSCTEDASSPLEPADPLVPSLASLKKKELIDLGQTLFFEETFGGNGRTCGTCHPLPKLMVGPDDMAALPPTDVIFAGALDVPDPALVAQGLFQYPLGGTLTSPDLVVVRAVPSIANTRTTGPFTADGRAATLQDQAMEAVLLHALDGAVDLPGERLPTQEELNAIAAFQESVREPVKSFGKKLEGIAKDGHVLFNNRARCSTCHFDNLFTDNGFHDTGVAAVNGLPFDPGRCRIDPLANDCAVSGVSFSTIALRGVRNTAPFFHDNSRATLREVLEFYDSNAFSSSPAAQRLGIGPLNLTDEEIDAIVAFLEEL